MKSEPKKQPKITAGADGSQARGRKRPVIKTSFKTGGSGLKAAGRQKEMDIDILSQIKDVVICVDGDEKIFCWNHAAENLYGVKVEDALGRDCREFFRIEWIEPIDESDSRQSMEKSGFWQGENIQILSNGDSIYVETSLSILKGKRNEVIGTLVVIRDITSRKRAELVRGKLLEQIVKQQQRIEESLWTIERERERYRIIVENAFEGILLADPDGLITFVNSRMAEMVGYTIDELVGRQFLDLVSSEQLPLMAVRRQQRRKGIVEQYDLKMVRKEGSVIWAMNHSVPLFDKEKKFTGYLAIFADISERKQAEMERETILRTAMDGFWLVDTQGRFLDVNNAYCKLIGYGRDELLKMGIRDVEARETETDIARRMQRLVETGAERFETRHKCKDGRTVDIEVSANYFDIHGGRLFVFLRDITGRKAMEAELAHLASFPERNPMPVVEMSKEGDIRYMNSAAFRIFPDMATMGSRHPFLDGVEDMISKAGDEITALTREVQVGDLWYDETVYCDTENNSFRFYGMDVTGRKKLDQVKDDFIGMVSHEMRTPLTVIMGALDTLSQDSEKLAPDERKQLLEDAAIESDELSHILDNLLELSRSQADRLKISHNAVVISDLLKKVIGKFGKQPGHRFILKSNGGIPVIEADPLRIERVIFNLVQNAVKYSPGGGPIELFADKQDGFIRVGIKDSGIGISSYEQARLFNPFQRVERGKYDTSKGIGLGLVVCKRLVEAHGGRIWLESEEGKGTTVFFTLPISPAGS
ncbi:MAG: PAS domain-containing sensor histidine kinase [Dehalococcoidia bacterium]|jgi:PAS domain S-box-containing protein